jgi:hypothetical protein
MRGAGDAWAEAMVLALGPPAGPDAAAARFAAFAGHGACSRGG